MALSTLKLTRSRLRIITVIIHRVWPILLAAYMALVVASPAHLALYGFGWAWASDVPLFVASVVLVASAVWPFRTWLVASSMALATWALMGRAATFALDDHAIVGGHSTVSLGWTRVIAIGAYTVLTVATVIIYFVHVVIDMEARLRDKS